MGKKEFINFLQEYGWALLVVLCAVVALIYFGVYNPDNLISSSEWKVETICVGYGDEEANMSMSVGEIQIALYMNYLFENPNATKNQINVIVNEASIDVLNITLSMVRFNIDGEEYEWIEEIIFPCVMRGSVFKS